MRTLKRIAASMAIVVSVLGITTATAEASVYSSCTQSRCSAARSANSTWDSYGYPSDRGWYDWPNGQCNYAGGVYQNRDGQLPSGDSFQEYDVYPRSCGASRDAYRIVVDMNTGVVWFSPDHYSNFYQL